MKTKEEVIKAAWEKFGIPVGPHVDENGWINIKQELEQFILSFLLDVCYEQDGLNEKIDKHLGKYRPKELRGIDDNNGWIRVADALPKISGEYLVITHAKPSSEETLHVDLEQGYGLNFLESHCTHYRLKEQLKRPLY